MTLLLCWTWNKGVVGTSDRLRVQSALWWTSPDCGQRALLKAVKAENLPTLLCQWWNATRFLPMHGLGPTAGQSVIAELSPVPPATWRTSQEFDSWYVVLGLPCQPRQQCAAPACSRQHPRDSFIETERGVSSPPLLNRLVSPAMLLRLATLGSSPSSALKKASSWEADLQGFLMQRCGRDSTLWTLLRLTQNPSKVVLSPVTHALWILALPSLLQNGAVT